MLFAGKEFYLKDLILENTGATNENLLRAEWWHAYQRIVAERVLFKSTWKVMSSLNATTFFPNIFINCVFECSDDQFWISGGDGRDEALFIFINPICHFEVNNARIFFSSKKDYIKCLVYNPIMTGVTTQISCRPFKLTDGEIYVFNPYIDIGSAQAFNC